MSLLPETLSLHKTTRKHYLSLTLGAESQVTYVWINEDKENLLSKTRTLQQEPAGIRDIPEWDTASNALNEQILVPVRMFRDPFTLDPNKLVLCEVLTDKYVPTGNSQRSPCVKVREEVKEFEPWFGMEQEYMLCGSDGKPYGQPAQGWKFRGVSCAVGSDNVYGRDISICHYRACLYAGVKIGGTNSETLGSQWEFQVGPCEGTELGDHLWMARYILHRVCEDFDAVASLDVKPADESSATSGCHINFSTKEMRSEGGLQYIEGAISRLSKHHSQHLSVYDPHGGADNKRRLTGQKTTSEFNKFSSAVGRRDVSVRIPGHVFRKGCGYFEDRRPAANCDPFSVIKALLETCLLGATEQDDEKERETMAS
ncbi:glutamine synthetase-like [Solea senegalensis]|uniref:Glutamine synthetase n=2 Tax=Solea senegalensis TaxID=28829 RepID=A0AAV6QB57_SOLSE|nr:glutamine synthetase-like [Solea senegalensis]